MTSRRRFLAGSGASALIGLLALKGAEAAPIATSSGITNPSMSLRQPDSSSASPYAVVSWTDSNNNVHQVRIDMTTNEALPFAIALAIKNGTVT